MVDFFPYTYFEILINISSIFIMIAWDIETKLSFCISSYSFKAWQVFSSTACFPLLFAVPCSSSTVIWSNQIVFILFLALCCHHSRSCICNETDRLWHLTGTVTHLKISIFSLCHYPRQDPCLSYHEMIFSSFNNIQSRVLFLNKFISWLYSVLSHIFFPKPFIPKISLGIDSIPKFFLFLKPLVFILLCSVEEGCYKNKNKK